jgi:hypothetical protein
MNRTHQTFSEQEKNKLLRDIENIYRVFAVFTLAVRSFRSSVQSSHMEVKALSPSTSSASRRSCLRNGGERIHARIQSLSTAQTPVPCLTIRMRCKFQLSKDGISPYGATFRNYALQDVYEDLRYGLYTVVWDGKGFLICMCRT